MRKYSKAKGKYQEGDALERVEDTGRSPARYESHVFISSWDWRCEEHPRD